MLNFTEDQLTQIDVQKKDNSIWIYWKNTSNPLKDGDIFSLESEIDSNTLTAKRTVIVFNAFKRLPVIFLLWRKLQHNQQCGFSPESEYRYLGAKL